MSDKNRHPLRCETCENVICQYNPKKQGYTINYHTYNVWEITKEIGCASHSSVGKAEQRIKDAIKELERRKILSHTRMNTYLDLGNDGNWQGGKEEGFDEAIALLQVFDGEEGMINNETRG